MKELLKTEELLCIEAEELDHLRLCKIEMKMQTCTSSLVMEKNYLC